MHNKTGDYIPRKTLFKTVEDYASTHPVINDNELFALFCSIPAADVRPVKRAHWKEDWEMGCSECSECGEGFLWEDFNGVAEWNFCPNCGVDMREES